MTFTVRPLPRNYCTMHCICNSAWDELDQWVIDTAVKQWQTQSKATWLKFRKILLIILLVTRYYLKGPLIMNSRIYVAVDKISSDIKHLAVPVW